MRDRAVAFLRQRRREHRFCRTIANHLWMLFREHHHPGRVAQLVCVVVGFVDFADAVIDDQPAVPRQDGRSASADLEPLPRRYWGGQPMMRIKQAEVSRFGAAKAIGQ